MSQIIYPITHLPPVIDIGKQTEKGVTRIGFDVHEWLDDWPGMAFSVQPTRPGETESYFAASEMVGSVVFWLVGAVDTEKPGSGTVEVLGVTEDERKLSFMCRTSIANTNTTTTAEIPEPNQPWVDQVILAGESAKADAKAAEKSAQDASQAATEAGQYSANADAQAEAAAKSAASASTFASDAEQANREASAQADDAEAAAKDAQAFAGNAAASADKAGEYAEASSESAQAAASSATAASASAKASAQSAANADASAKAAAASEATVERYSANADAQAQAAVQSASGAAASAAEAVAARDKAIAQADDAEQSAKDAATYAQHSQAHQESALAASDDAAASAEAAKASASESAASASAAAASAVDAAESVQDVFVVKVDQNQMCSHTKQEIVGAASSGKVCLMVYYNGEVLKYKGLTRYGDETTCPYFVGSLYKSTSGDEWYAAKVTVLSDNKTAFDGSPIRIANPNSLRFTGAVEATYNGSEGVTVNIPEGGGAGLPETADPLMQLVTDADGKVTWDDRLAYKSGETQVENLASTELTGEDDNGDGTPEAHYLLSPWAADLVAGAVATVTYNGTAYACPVLDYSQFASDAPAGTVVMGNLDAAGVEGIEGSNPDAPFFLIAIANDVAASEMGGMYGMLMAIDGAATVTIAVSSVITTYKTIDKPYLPKQEALTFTGAVEATYDGSGPVSVEIPEAPTIPTALPNPNKLTLTGAVSATYDGSSAVTVKIPTMPTIPTPTTSDAGKFLRVNSSGAYALEAIASAEEATF